MSIRIDGLALMGLAFIASSTLQAQIIAWKDTIPSSLQPFQNNAQQLAHLTQDKILIFAHPPIKTALPTSLKNPNPTAHFTSSALIVPVSTATVEKTLSHYSQYVGLMPNLKSAQVLERGNGIAQVKYKISIPTPIPILNLNEDIILQHQLSHNSLASIVIDAPIPYAVGKFEWFSLGDNTTLLTLTQWGDLDQPKGFLIGKILSAIPEAKWGIPSGTHAFILESLRKKWLGNPVTALNAGQLPSTQLSPQQLNKIAQISQVSQQPVSLIHRPTSMPYAHGREAMRFVTTYQHYVQRPQQLQKWTQPANYKSLFPRQIKSISTGALKDKSQDAVFKVSVGLGVISIPFQIKINFKYPSATENEFSANGGDLKYLKGEMQFLPEKSGSLLKITSAVKIDEQAPFLLRAVRSLPYQELLPAVGANVVFAQKIRQSNAGE